MDGGNIVYSFHYYAIYTAAGDNRIFAAGDIRKIRLAARLFCIKAALLRSVSASISRTQGRDAYCLIERRLCRERPATDAVRQSGYRGARQGIGNRLCQRGVIFLQGINGGYRVIYAVRDLIAVVRLDYIWGAANVINPYLLVLLEELMETIIQQLLIKDARDTLLKKIDELMP